MYVYKLDSNEQVKANKSKNNSNNSFIMQENIKKIGINKAIAVQ